MDCNTAERALVEHGGDLPDAVREHVAGYPSCRDFARLQQALLEQDAGAAPSAALDRAVVEAAHRRLRRSWRHLPRLRLVLRAAAAVLVLAATLSLLLRRRADRPPTVPLATAASPTVEARHWAGAEVDLEVIEGGLDADIAELGTVDAPGHGSGAALDSKEPWDALMELEFDVYFESESLRQAGG
jgi:anti-sigma-K factor RskA